MANKTDGDGIDVVEIEPHELMKGLIDVIRDANEHIGYYQIKEMTGSHLDQAIAQTVQREKERKKIKLTSAQILNLAAKLYNDIMMRWTLSAISALSKYYSESNRMSYEKLIDERHNSRRLARHLRAVTGIKRPPNTATHAIVGGVGDGFNARAAREILAKWKIRIDDPANGVFLPKNSDHTPHPEMPNAINHAKLHTDRYYVNVVAMLSQTKSASECRTALGIIAKELRNGTFEY